MTAPTASPSLEAAAAGRWLRRSAGGAAALLLLGVGALVSLASFREVPARAPAPRRSLRVAIATAQRQDYPEVYRAYARARALRTTLVSAEVRGLVVWVAPALEAGTAVRAGQELLKIDDRELRAIVAARRAAAQEAAAARTALEQEHELLARQRTIAERDLGTARGEVARSERLARSGETSQSALDRARLQCGELEQTTLELAKRCDNRDAELARAEARHRAALAGQEQAELDLARATVRAPHDGTIERRLTTVGSRVGPGSPLARIVDASRVEVAASLPASCFGDVAPGAPITLRRAADAAPIWSGSVARIAPGVDETNRTFDVYVTIDRSGAAAPPIPPGSFVLADVEGRTHRDVLPLPRAALRDGELLVVVPGADGVGTIRTRRPRVVAELADVVLVGAGVEPGDHFVTNPSETIGPGDRVAQSGD